MVKVALKSKLRKTKSRYRSRGRNISLIPVRTQTVSLEEFLKFYEERASEMVSTRIVPPNLGSNHFGRIIIEWKNPVYVPVSSIKNGRLA